MSRKRAITGLGMAAALTGLLWVSVGATDEPSGSEGAAATSADTGTRAEPAADRLRVFLDPVTGELLTRPVPGAVELEQPGLRPGVSHWLNTYSGDLIEEALPNGGFMVDLRGRFRTALVATIDPETGEVTTDCVVSGNNGAGGR